MQHLNFVQESPKEKFDDMTEEEVISKIFPLNYEKVEIFDEISLEKLYYLNDTFPQKLSTKTESIRSEESTNQLLLINDYEAAFNQLESNSNSQENNIIIQCYENEEYSNPSFIKNIVSENKFFCPIKDENNEINIKIESERDKLKKVESKNKRSNKVEILNQKIKKQDSNQDKKRTIRGPYKKKEKKIEKINTDDKCFPFSTGKGIFNFTSPIMRINSNLCTIEYSADSEENLEKKSFEFKNKNEEFEEGKTEEILDINDEINLDNDNSVLKFITKKYFIAPNGKKKRIKKKRKFKPDDIRKKIKARFHKMIKNIINENLKKAGSKELFDFIPQTFIGNISKKVNSKVLDLTYKEILSTNFNEELKIVDSLNNNIDNNKYLKNQKVLKYLEENPEISERAGFDIVQNMKYKDLLKIYFTSAQFENSINQLKVENESPEYIEEYIYRAKTYIRFYSNFDNHN